MLLLCLAAVLGMDTLTGIDIHSAHHVQPARMTNNNSLTSLAELCADETCVTQEAEEEEEEEEEEEGESSLEESSTTTLVEEATLVEEVTSSPVTGDDSPLLVLLYNTSRQKLGALITTDLDEPPLKEPDYINLPPSQVSPSFI